MEHATDTVPETSRGGRLLPLIVLAVLAAIIGVARLHTYHEPLERDITTYAVIAHEWLDGRPLYADLWDHKPPGVHVTYALAELATGYGYGAIYLMGVAAAVATLLGVYAAGSAVGGRAAGLWAAGGWTVVCGDLYLQANQPNTEVFINALFVWALALLLRSDRRPLGFPVALLAGSLFAVASLYKQVAVIAAALLFAAHVIRPPRGTSRGRAAAHAAVAAGIGIVTWLAVFGYFLAVGRFDDFYNAAFVYNREYGGSVLSNVAKSFLQANLMPSSLVRVALPLLVVPLVGIVRAVWRRELSGRTWLLLGATAVATQIAVAMPGKFFPHYYQLWLPLLVILAGVGITSLHGLLPKGSAWWPCVGGAIVLGWLLVLEAPLYRLSPDDWSREKYGEAFVESRDLGREIAAMLEPGETFYQWGNETGLYFESGLRPTSGITFIYPLFGSRLSPELETRLLHDLRQRPPDLFVLNMASYRDWMQTHPVMRWTGPLYRPAPGDPRRGRFVLLVRRGSRLEARLTATAP